MPVARQCLANSSTYLANHRPMHRGRRGEVQFREEGLFNKLPCKDVNFKSRRVNGMQNSFSSFNLLLAEWERGECAFSV